ncbi:MAG: GcrA family cell cycle regulator [Methylocella sp.]
MAASRQEASIRRELSEHAERPCAPFEVIEASYLRRHPRGCARVTQAVAGDPAHGRSALGGFVQKGDAFDPARWGSAAFSHALPEARLEPSKPERLRHASPFVRIGVAAAPWSLAYAAKAVEGVSGCRFPIGEPRADEFRFCNAPRHAGCSYCEEHAKLCREGRR